MIVVDTNIIAYLLLPTPYSDATDALLRSEPEWVAPALWRSEFRNVLAGYIRKGIVTLEAALRLQENAEAIITEFHLPSARVLALVRESNCSAYDCEFVALAHQLAIPLITQDEKILRAFPVTSVSITGFLGH
uniref:Ribonuclease VapC n=1 Tax=Candidatus Kentrum sp. FM TaxID=2126340 RepID=A0A450SMD1_9GAMM|nr:MAG: Predicted nucleic acid-binding protein, contains PIN domain [Candidatus Kentron sp. FM]VFJ55654.1 MAG: Predicted nucleic acid-binding protein, contains PIN domain [Candidatus Kentron sp. FM]VFK10773.1 MAG: Predicted nucleic acid-binding protein, contains PIN domain [Candidatus Kentron sp. FM]